MKIIDQTIQVQSSAGMPLSFFWERKYPYGHKEPGVTVHIKEVIEYWRETGQWWDGELEKVFYKVRAENASAYEIYRDSKGAWGLYKMLD